MGEGRGEEGKRKGWRRGLGGGNMKWKEENGRK